MGRQRQLAQLAQSKGRDSIYQVAWDYLRHPGQGIRYPEGGGVNAVDVDWNDVVAGIPTSPTVGGLDLLKAAHKELVRMGYGNTPETAQLLKDVLNMSPKMHQEIQQAYDRKVNASKELAEELAPIAGTWIAKYWDKQPENTPAEQIFRSEDEARKFLNKLPTHYVKALRPARAAGHLKDQGVAEGFLNEANSLKGTIDSIVVHGEAIAQIYEQMKSAAKKYVDNHGELEGFSMVAAGIGSRWFQSFYFNKLQNELYALVKQAPKYSPLLLDFLKSEDSKSFGRVAKGLPGILEQIGSELGSQELMRFGKHWAQRRSDYQAYLSGLEDDDDYDDGPQEKKPKDTTQGQQNAQAAVLINQGIKDHIPAKYQGKVRNMIDRLPMEKRIIALQQAIEKFKGMNESKQGVVEGHKTIKGPHGRLDVDTTTSGVTRVQQKDRTGAKRFGLPFKTGGHVGRDTQQSAPGASSLLNTTNGVRRATPRLDHSDDLREEQDVEGVERAILHRIMVGHKDLLLKYGPQKVMQAAEEVAYNTGDISEIGTSDVSGWVQQVEQILGAVSEAKAVKTRLDPACWTGKKIGNPKTKVKNGVRVNNCVPK